MLLSGGLPIHTAKVGIVRHQKHTSHTQTADENIDKSVSNILSIKITYMKNIRFNLNIHLYICMGKCVYTAEMENTSD